MMTRHIGKSVGLCLAALSAAAMIVDPSFAGAQGVQGSEDASQAPPTGQYAPPPAGAQSGQSNYDDRAQQADRDYAERYSRWAAQYCVDQHNNNTAAGAIIGGVFGAVLGAGVGGHNPAAGALVGGALGAGTGAAIGATASSNSCPPGYVVRVGAPAFVYAGPYYAPAFAYGPAWYRPWVWSGGHWVYYPYRYWYWFHRGYWRPGWVGHPWRYRYRRW